MYDWNHDGKRDMKDRYIDYCIYQETSKSSGSSGCSGLVAFLIAISGLIIQAFIYTLLGIDPGNIPALVLVFLWLFFSGLVAVGASKIGWL